jgi:cob(I)alamin adenosyltransferase
MIPPSSMPNAGECPLRDITEAEAEAHKAKMEAQKAEQDARVAENKQRKGLLIVNTGDGKGKSTAAFGLALRMLGHGRKVGIVQFIKGTWKTGEREAFKVFGDQVVWRTMGEGFTWETQDLSRDVAAARAAWQEVRLMLADPDIALIVLDEVNIALRYDYLEIADVVADLTARRPDLQVVCTGRSAKPELMEVADLVSEISAQKHHFDAGVQAQRGIEY